MKKVLVIGHTGFIGSHLYQFLLEQDDVNVLVFNHRISPKSQPDLIAFLERNDFDYIYFLADINGNSSWLKSNSYDQYSLNTSLSILFIDAVIASCTNPKIIYLGSVWSMPLNVESASESNFVNSCPAGELKPYSLSKKFIYSALHLARLQYNLNFTYFITCTVAGPNDKSDHLLPTLYRKVLEGCNPINIYSDGSESRSFIHVLDLVKGLYLLRDIPNEVMNISSNNSSTIFNLCECIQDYIGSSIRFSFSSNPGSYLPSLSTALSESACGWPSAFELQTLDAIIKDIFHTLRK